MKLDRCLERIARLNPLLRAFLSVDAAGARAAGRALSPVDGMIFGIKANIAVAGWPFHAGVAAYRHRIAERDAACVARLRAGGAILLGSLNMDEAALGDVTDNPHFGRTENPHRPGMTAGGSSGGCAAAVAAGMCDAALGTDTLGSVRIPAAYCGVFGHKPVRGGISAEGVVPLAPGFDTVGILANTAETAGAVRDWLRNGTSQPVAKTCGDIGILAPDTGGAEQAVAAAFAGIVEKARRLGFAVHPVPPLAHSLRDIAKAALLEVELQAAAFYRADRDRETPGFSAGFLQMLDWAESQSPARVQAARMLLAESAAEIRRSFAPFDAVLMPTTPGPAFAFGGTRPVNTADFTTLANIAGLAATAFPAGDADGMPLSVQAVGADEDSCLLLAGQLAVQGRNIPETG